MPINDGADEMRTRSMQWPRLSATKRTLVCWGLMAKPVGREFERGPRNTRTCASVVFTERKRPLSKSLTTRSPFGSAIRPVGVKKRAAVPVPSFEPLAPRGDPANRDTTCPHAKGRHRETRASAGIILEQGGTNREKMLLDKPFRLSAYRGSFQ